MRVPLRAAIVLAVVVAVVLAETTTRSGVLWRLTTFTYQANLFAAAYYLWTLASPRADRNAGLRGAVVVYLIVAGVVWSILLAAPHRYTPANILLHIVVPLLAVVDWLFVGQSQNSVRWWQPIVWLAYPAGYLVLALLVLNGIGRRAPYYFLDPKTVGATEVAVNACLIASGALLLGYSLWAAGRLLAPRIAA